MTWSKKQYTPPIFVGIERPFPSGESGFCFATDLQGIDARGVAGYDRSRLAARSAAQRARRAETPTRGATAETTARQRRFRQPRCARG